MVELDTVGEADCVCCIWCYWTTFDLFIDRTKLVTLPRTATTSTATQCFFWLKMTKQSKGLHCACRGDARKSDWEWLSVTWSRPEVAVGVATGGLEWLRLELTGVGKWPGMAVSGSG